MREIVELEVRRDGKGERSGSGVGVGACGDGSSQKHGPSPQHTRHARIASASAIFIIAQGGSI